MLSHASTTSLVYYHTLQQRQRALIICSSLASISSRASVCSRTSTGCVGAKSNSITPSVKFSALTRRTSTYDKVDDIESCFSTTQLARKYTFSTYHFHSHTPYRTFITISTLLSHLIHILYQPPHFHHIGPGWESSRLLTSMSWSRSFFSC